MRYMLAILFAFLLFGCKTKIQYVPVETVKSDTTYIYQLRIDSVYDKDSIYIKVNGDTVTEYRCKYLYKYIYNTDTLFISKTDSISVPYPVEAKLTTWQQVKVNYGGWAILSVLIFIIIVFGSIVYKIKR